MPLGRGRDGVAQPLREYNGYKAYWTDGAQVTAPHDKNIIAEVEKITDVDMVLKGAASGERSRSWTRSSTRST